MASASNTRRRWPGMPRSTQRAASFRQTQAARSDLSAILRHAPASELVPIDQAGHLYPVPAHRATVFRHKQTGIKRGDRRVKLRTLRVGGRCFTTKAWVLEFLAELNRDETPPATQAIVSPRQQQARAAMAALKQRKAV
jgi:hypothetical protein